MPLARTTTKPEPTPTKRGRPGKRAPQPKKTLALDPGKHTGYAIHHNGSITHAGATLLKSNDYQALATQLDQLIEQHAPDRVIIEGWENQGKRVNIHSSTPNVVIGILAALTAQRQLPLHTAYSSEWKTQLGKGALYLPATPTKVPKPDEPIARRIQLELEHWPTALAELKSPILGHAISAAGLAIWAQKALR